MSRSNNVLFIFRRDLRIQDNKGLNRAVQVCEALPNGKLILAFVFSKHQIDESEYYSEKAFRFMLQCLEDLNERVDGKLEFFDTDDFYERVPALSAVVFNADYTPYARKRDGKIAKYCKARGIDCFAEEDYTLHPIRAIKTKQDGRAYQVFGPFFRQATSGKVDRIPTAGFEDVASFRASLHPKSFGDAALLDRYLHQKRFTEDFSEVSVVGGRTPALRALDEVDASFAKRYGDARDFPAKGHTTGLSPYIKFGCVSVREVCDVFRRFESDDLLKQLYWREFYANVAFHYKHVLRGMASARRNLEMYPKFRTIKWKYSKLAFARWCRGETGVPIVDAGMRQLNRTGIMHNRLRMITASFLIKNLHIDWRWGERYFARKLIDYDPASNNGGWQWVAGTGTDASEYYRVFNPLTQTERFDEEAAFVYEHVPELREVDAKDVLRWDEPDVRKRYPRVEYSGPMVDLKKSSKRAKEVLYKI